MIGIGIGPVWSDLIWKDLRIVVMWIRGNKLIINAFKNTKYVLTIKYVRNDLVRGLFLLKAVLFLLLSPLNLI